MVDFAYAAAQAPSGGPGAVMTQVLFFAAIFILANLVVDLSYAILDPRIRYA